MKHLRINDFVWNIQFTLDTGHSTNFQVGGDNPIVEGIGEPCNTSMQNKTKFYFDIFTFENEVAGGKIQVYSKYAWLLYMYVNMLNL